MPDIWSSPKLNPVPVFVISIIGSVPTVKVGSEALTE